jgi:hypothetical protein
MPSTNLLDDFSDLSREPTMTQIGMVLEHNGCENWHRSDYGWMDTKNSYYSSQNLLPNTQGDFEYIHATWPSILTNSAGHLRRPVALAIPLEGNAPRLPATSSVRKVLTNSDRRRMCQYHEDYPKAKQTEIGGEIRIPNECE